MLKHVEIRLLVDIRAIPRSRTNPQYDQDRLPAALSEFQIGYEHMAALGGLRGRKPDVPPIANAFWENQSFHNYADYAQTEPFRSALLRLLMTGHERRCAVMCAEAVWWRCHRRIVADYLIAAGESVFHILGKDRIEPARLTGAAERRPDGSLGYPAHALPPR